MTSRKAWKNLVLLTAGWQAASPWLGLAFALRGWRPWADQMKAMTPKVDCQQANAVEAWVRRVVVAHGLCPWADGALRQGSLAVVSLFEDEEEQVAAALVSHAQLLALQHPPEGAGATTLLVAPRCEKLLDFEGYLELCDWVEEAFSELDLIGKVQMAAFHPDFRFNGSDAADCANFVGRAPYPAFHLLREEEVSAALASFHLVDREPFQGPEEVGAFIAERNARFLRNRGREACLRSVRACDVSDLPRGQGKDAW